MIVKPPVGRPCFVRETRNVRTASFPGGKQNRDGASRPVSRHVIASLAAWGLLILSRVMMKRMLTRNASEEFRDPCLAGALALPVSVTSTARLRRSVTCRVKHATSGIVAMLSDCPRGVYHDETTCLGSSRGRPKTHSSACTIIRRIFESCFATLIVS